MAFQTSGAKHEVNVPTGIVALVHGSHVMAVMSSFWIFSPTGVGTQQTKGRKWRRRQPGKVVNRNPKLENVLRYLVARTDEGNPVAFSHFRSIFLNHSCSRLPWLMILDGSF